MAAVKTSISKSGNSPGSAARGLPLRFLKLSSAPCRCGRCGVDVRGPPACPAVPPAVPPNNTSACSHLSSLGGPLVEHRSPRRSPPRDNPIPLDSVKQWSEEGNHALNRALPRRMAQMSQGVSSRPGHSSHVGAPQAFLPSFPPSPPTISNRQSSPRNRIRLGGVECWLLRAPRGSGDALCATHVAAHMRHLFFQAWGPGPTPRLKRRSTFPQQGPASVLSQL